METVNDNPINDESITADAVLIAFAQAGPEQASLTDWMRRYPDQARDLARFAASRAWEKDDGGTGEDENAATARVREIGLSVVRSCRPAASPLKNLLAAVRAQNLDADAVAARLEVPVAVFWKLHRRLLAPESVPQSLIAALAQTVQHGTEQVAAYLRQPPTLAAGASYRSDDAPRVGERENFADALRADPDTTPAQSARWLSGKDEAAAGNTPLSDEA